MSYASFRRSLDALEERWQAETDQAFQVRLAKLYCLECCGWIECWVDDFFETEAGIHIAEEEHKKIFRRKLRDTYGFEYERHIQPLITSLRGLKFVSQLEPQLNQTIHQQMIANLNNLKTRRNQLAHTHTDGVQIQIPAPSVSKTELRHVVTGLLQLKRKMRTI